MRDLRGRYPRCDRIRALAALEVDGELSQLETAYLDRHADECVDCRAFRGHVVRFTAELRQAPAARPRMRFWVPRRERAAWLLGAARAGRGLAGVAAVAATAVAVLVPAQLGTGSQGNAASTATAASSPPAAVMGGREIVGGLGGIVGGDSLLIT